MCPQAELLPSLMNQSTKKVALALGVTSVAASMGGNVVQAGPALQSLNNITNTAEFSINNTYGQSFSVDGVLNAAVVPFAGTSIVDSSSFRAGTATLTTGFTNGSIGGFKAVETVKVNVETITGAIVAGLNMSAMTAISITGNGTAVVTIGASISSTLFGPSTVKATSSFTNQLINDLSAF